MNTETSLGVRDADSSSRHTQVECTSGALPRPPEGNVDSGEIEAKDNVRTPNGKLWSHGESSAGDADLPEVVGRGTLVHPGANVEVTVTALGVRLSRPQQVGCKYIDEASQARQ